MSIAHTNSHPAYGVRGRTWLRSVPPLEHDQGPASDLETAIPAVVAPPLVPTATGELVEYANFDHGASTPAFQSVADAVEASTQTYSSVHRGQGWLSQISSHYYEAARKEVAAFVGARESDEVIFTRNTTDSFALLAGALPRHTHVVLFSTEHHATLLPWPKRRTRRLPVPATAIDARALLVDALRHSPRGRTLVVLSGASNVTGEFWPLESLIQTAQAAGARVAVDAAQLVAHREVNLAQLGADYLAFSGHKIHAPYGAGVLVGRRDWLDAAQPYLIGGGATAEVTTTTVTWRSGPARHEAGTPNIIGAVAIAAACATIARHRSAIEAHEARLRARLLAGLGAIEGVQVHTIFGSEADGAPVATFTIDGIDSALVSAALSAEHGIGVRDGKFCAHPLVDELLGDTDHTSAVRVSGGLATTLEHVDRLVTAVRALATDGPALPFDYAEGAGWLCTRDQRSSVVDLPW